ncbi:MAG: DUF1003 domain-containing protein [Candidatus Dojkabacteria bacterium]|nr:DUF1003 domain-containing protein [Candidatus Dojkabacteria bacterium]MDQ7020237.1 DUF1003 domain-containing protein [Candidatus Dojkabacteria bacterium]
MKVPFIYQSKTAKTKVDTINKTFKRRAKSRRSFAEKLADWLTESSGTFLFLMINLIWFVVWIVINLELIPGIDAFDPYPFGLLTTIVSLEAIVLSIIVLISQNRESKVNDIRSEVDTYIDIAAEEEIKKALEILKKVAEKLEIKDFEKDEVLDKMVKKFDENEIESIIEAEIR